MKKIFFALSSICLLAFQSMGQACPGVDTSGPTACVPNGSVVGPGFEDPSSIPCIVDGIAYDSVMQFNMYNTFNFQGHQTVDSIEFVSISSLPTGICWATCHSNNRFVAGESGCLILKGTTTASPGQYKMALSIKAWINGGSTGNVIPPYLVDQAGVKLWIRVKAQGGSCPNVDTSQGSFLYTGISEVENNVFEMNIAPNPMTSNSELSFTAEGTGFYTIRMTDMTGRVISTKQIEAKAGLNTTVVERNGLPAGIYFISLSNGQAASTRRFSIAD
jgi:hypothetical protein